MSIAVRTADEMRTLGARVAGVCRAGDVIVLDGPLGAGKTTFVQGMAAALGVRDPITSPTFVIARAHRGAIHDLVHVDAYRIGSGLELDDLDLDADVASSVTVVEWGSGKADRLADDRLLVRIERSDDPDDETRTVTMVGIGARWSGDALRDIEATA